MSSKTTVAAVVCAVLCLLNGCGTKPDAAPPVVSKDGDAPKTDAPSSELKATPPKPAVDPAKTSPPRAKLSPAEVALQRGAAQLIALQGDDGSWPCNYKQIEGPGATGLALFALSYVPDAARPKNARQRADCALAYLIGQIDKHGRIVQPPQTGQTEGPPAYPTYEGALLLISARRMSLEAPPEKLRAIVDYLLKVQMHEGNGFKPEDVHYGGWDMTGDPEARAYTIGTNVNITAFVAEALSMERKARADEKERSKKIDDALARTAKWVLRCRSAEDGGYWLSANPQDFMNKAQWYDEARMRPRSYGTATADALRVLVACGANKDDAARAGAIKWLTERDAVDKVPGFEKIPQEIGWQDGLRFYYQASLARVLPYFPADVAAKRREALLAQIMKQQREDGGWANEAAQMREDDPVVATSLALIALGAIHEPK